MPKLDATAKSERRRRLVEAAWRCVATGGFRDLTVDTVCAEAGVSKGAFYVYFRRKRDLLAALLDDETSTIDGLMESLAATDLSWVERLRRVVRAMLQRGEDPARVQVRADLWVAIRQDPALRDALAESMRRRRAVLRDWIERGTAAGEIDAVPANALAAMLLALGDGLMLHAGLDPGGFRWPNIRRAMDAMLDGLGPARGPALAPT